VDRSHAASFAASDRNPSSHGASNVSSNTLSSESARLGPRWAKELAHAHQRGVLHRDLKPATVFVCEDGRVKLLDFGLAHLLGTEGVSGAGTPMYMAPEHACGAWRSSLGLQWSSVA
jgi:serine/threonine protein kinase